MNTQQLYDKMFEAIKKHAQIEYERAIKSTEAYDIGYDVHTVWEKISQETEIIDWVEKLNMLNDHYDKFGLSILDRQHRKWMREIESEMIAEREWEETKQYLMGREI